MMVDWIEAVFIAGKSDGSIRTMVEPEIEAAATLPLLEGARLSARAEEKPGLFESAMRVLVDQLQ